MFYLVNLIALLSVLRIRDVYPGSDFFHPGYRIRIQEFKYGILTPKNGFQALGNMILVVHPGSGSGIRILIFCSSRIQGSKRHRIPDPDLHHCLLSFVTSARKNILLCPSASEINKMLFCSSRLTCRGPGSRSAAQWTRTGPCAPSWRRNSTPSPSLSLSAASSTIPRTVFRWAAAFLSAKRDEGSWSTPVISATLPLCAQQSRPEKH
jgi:hypothetical protein